MSVDVSVVVPVYNTSRFLRECVDSLINQTLKNVEFIFVDDGSTDNSVEILKQYQKKDDRITILQQENLHAGTARNNGMKLAKGKYIIFLDSDDYFDLTLLEKAFCCAEKNSAEIVFFGHYKQSLQSGAIRKYPFRMRKGVFSAKSLGDKVFTSFHCVPWNKLYLRSFIDKNRLEYQTLLKHNDVYFAFLSVALAERIACVGEPLVYYRFNNPESLQGQKTPAYPYLTEAFSALKESLRELGIFKGNIREGYNRTLSSSIEKRCRNKPEVMLSKEFYTAMKQNLIPRLFDSPEDINSKKAIPRAICESTDFDNYLILVTEELSRNNSKDYIIGHALLRFPRFIKRMIRH